MGDVLIGRVAQEVAAEKVARFDAVGFQMRGDVVAGEPGTFPDGNHVTEPGGIGILCGPGQDEAVCIGCHDLGEFKEILLTPGDEVRKFLELGAANGGLHIRHLEVVAYVAVNVFMVVAIGQSAKLLAEALAAGVVFPTCAVAVPAPVADGTGNAGKIIVIRGHAAPLAQGDVMGGVEGEGGEVAESAGKFISVGGAQGVAVIFDEPEIVLIDEIHDSGEAERDAHRVGHHDRFCFGSDGVSQPFGDSGIVAEVHIHKDGNQPILEDGVERRGKAAGRCDDLITGLEAAILELRRSQGG